MKKRILSILLVVCMVVTMLPTAVLAASNPTVNSFDISEGHIIITNGTTSGTVKVAYGSSQSKDNINGDTILISGTTTSNKVIVNTSSNITVKIRLDSLDIRLANDCAFDIQNASVVEMTLAGANILKSGQKQDGYTNKAYAGLQVENAAQVTIDGTGSLEAMGGDYAAGIGGRAGEWTNNKDYGVNSNAANSGKITIKSGTVKATGSYNGAGIGGGGAAKTELSGGNGGEVAITGGIVIATGGDWRGAGIGGGGSGKGGAGGTIIITGGDVTALGGGNAAGIGGSGFGVGDLYAGAAGNIKISNAAKVVAASSGTKPSIEDDDGNIAPVSGTVANVLIANYQTDIAANTNTEVKDASSNLLSPAVSFAPQRGYKSIAFTMPTANGYTLYTGAAKQMGKKDGITSTTFTIAPGLNVFTDVAASTYTGNVTVKKDNNSWTADAPIIKMSASSSTLTGAVSGTFLNGEYTFSGLADGTTYYAWEDGATDTYTGRSVTIDSKSATVNYYTLSLANGAGTSSLIGSGIHLQGKSVAIDVTVNTGYVWSKWTSDNATLLPDQTAKSGDITMPAAPITLTATATPIRYDITYTLNGGTVSAANPENYNVESDAITLNNPARSGYYFLGWTGSSGEVAQTNVSIPKGTTGNKTYTANWKAYTPTSAPIASVVTARTDTSITINTETGYEYSVDGTKWFIGSGSYTFSGLEPDTPYSLVYRKAAVNTSGSAYAASEASPALSVRTKISSALVTAPGAPGIGTGTDKPTSDSIAISAVAGNEYYISTSPTSDWSGTPNGYYKATSDGIRIFDSLSPATKYYIHFRTAETVNAMPSVSAHVEQYTLPTTPLASVITTNYVVETINFDNTTYEVSSDSSFVGEKLMPNGAVLTPGETYYVRVKAITGGAPASEAASFTISPRPAAPTSITAIKTKNSIIITPVLGQEYKIGDGIWQDGGSFEGLGADTEYIVYARVKATDSAFASEGYSINIKTKVEGSITVPTPEAVTYEPATTLGAITLSPNWAWSLPTTNPTVAIASYNAIYTPTDTDTVDYSGVAGYAVDGSGKVTITRLIPLTVNRAIPTAADFTFVQPASLDYSGTVKTATVTAKTGISGMGTVTVVYNPGETTASPVNAGTYSVQIDLAQGDNYAAATSITDGTWEFSIAKVTQAALSITSIPANVTYGDSFTLDTSGGSGTGAVTWAVTEGDSAMVDAAGNVTITGIGATTIAATKAADGNHADAVTDTYAFTPAPLQLIIDDPVTTGGWTKTYDGNTDFDLSRITVGAITNKVGSDDITVSVQSATYDAADIGLGNKTLTITYATEGDNSGTYSVPGNYVANTASVTAATPVITLVNKTAVYSDKIIGIDEATVTGVTGGTTPDGIIAYTYYTKETCGDEDKTTVDKNGAEVIGGAPKNAGTYYVKAMIAASGNYSVATSGAVTLTIYYPSSGLNASVPVIVDGKTVDMGTAEVKDGTTTIKVDQDKMREQLKSAKDSVVIPINSNTNTAAAQLVVQNVENMAERSMTLTIKSNDISYEIPTGSVDTAAILKNLGAADSSKVPLNVTIGKLTQNSVTVKDGTLVMVPVSFTITATYNGKSVEVDKFESYVHRVIEIPSGVDPKTITTAVVVEKNGAQRHVPTEVYSKGGMWYANINSLTNSTYALINSKAEFADTNGKWYTAVAAEMASRKILSGVGENKFAGDRSITRAEFAAILVRALGLPADGKSIFVDVSPSAWYSGAIATAAEYGLVTGKGDNEFAPGAYITRQEAMTMLQRAAKLADYSGGDGSLGNFADAGSISKWAQNAAKWNVGSGLIVGSGGLIRPSDNITRAESGAVILRLLQKAGLVDVRS